MGEPLPRAGTPSASLDIENSTNSEPTAVSKPQYLPYRPPGSEFTPPASPQPLNPYSTKKGFGSGRSKHPVNLQMDTSVPPAYERPTYSPSPSSSPPLPPSLPSPKFPPRQRAPSLLRHAAVSSPLNDGYPRAEQPVASPTFAPTMARQTSGPGASSDPRSIFNPLASNPVNQSGPSWESSSEDVPAVVAQQRMRGMTSASQPSFQPHPPLRSATSIPDYGQFRTSDRPNLSGAYRPNRGIANWSHNEHYPLRHLRGEEPRASFRSGWTNASSSFMEASGTERSSIATGRSSVISNNRASTYSRDRSDDQDRSTDTLPTSADDDDVMSTVEDVIDAYCYDEEERAQETFDQSLRDRLSSSPIALDSGTPELSQTHSNEDSRASYHSSEHAQKLNDRPMSYVDNAQSNMYRHVREASKHRLSVPAHAEATDSYTPNNSFDTQVQAEDASEHQQQHTSYLPPLQLSPLQVQYSPTKYQSLDEAAEELSPRTSIPPQQAVLDPSASPERGHDRAQGSRPMDRRHMKDIHRELKDLPQLPTKKCRISRQDWADIQAYSQKRLHERGASGHSSIASPTRELQNPMSSSPQKTYDPLPEVDEDEAYPRRASTSIFDRRSTLFELGKVPPPKPNKSKTTDFGNAPAGKRRIDPLATFGRISPVQRDQYGFKKSTDKISIAEYDAWYSKYEEQVSRRRNKWVALMAKNGLTTHNPSKFPDRCDKVKRYARKGYPPEWRGAMWWFYSGGQYKSQELDMVGLYPSLVARVNQGELNKDDREAIERDLDRTFPDNIHFRPDPTLDSTDGKPAEEPSLIRDLREVLSCFALNNPSIGYCQSLNFIAGLLLLFLKQDNERVFVLLTIITQHHLPGAHARSLANTEVNVLMMLIKDYLPKVWVSINDTDLVNSGPGSRAHPDSKFQRQPTVALSCTSWFMSIFVGVLPIETVLRVWDAFLYEGPRALYRYALAIFKLGEGEIRKYRPGDGELFMAVQNLPRRCLDPNILHDIAFVKKGFGSLTQNVIDQKRLFWREQNDRARKPSFPAQGQKSGFLAVSAEEKEDGEEKKGLGGLRRKASKRFLKKRA